MKKNNNHMIFLYIIVLTLSVLLVRSIYNNEPDVIEYKQIVLERENINVESEEVVDYLISEFSDLSKEDKIEKIDNMYFYTCKEIESYCSDIEFEQLQGCQFCLNK